MSGQVPGSRIELTINGRAVEGYLYDNPVAQQIAQMLPLKLNFEDFNAVEKLAPFPARIDLRGVPKADAPQAGEIGFYAPGSTLVLYYESPGRWPGLVRIGRFDFDLAALRELPDGTPISLALV